MFKLELFAGAPKENMLAVEDDVDAAEGSEVSGVLKMRLLSTLSDSGTFVTESVAPTASEARLHIKQERE